MNILCDIALRWIPQNTFDEKSTLVTSDSVDPDLYYHMASLGKNEFVLVAYFLCVICLKNNHLIMP